ncbi:MAG TPA: hypothetical protein DIU08_00075, partial [Ktedonobacter sp.]|nr:hypothetical protein [Ktedonobacter sp.]
MPHNVSNFSWTTFFMAGLVILAVLVAGCGAESTAGTTSSGVNNGSSIPAPTNANSQKSTAPGGTQQYLIKSLNITMEVKDTQKVASDLQSWMSTTDPLSTA